MWYKNIAGRFFGLVTKHACDGRTDGQTDGQNYDSQDRASIARAVKTGSSYSVFHFSRKRNVVRYTVHLVTAVKFSSCDVNKP